MVTAHRKALQRLWRDRCWIFHQVEETNPVTHLTSFVERPLLEDEPCKLSFETLTSTSGDHVAAAGQSVKLFLSSNVEIPPGCKIVIRRFNDPAREFVFSKSGLVGVFTSHQEIFLEPFKEYA